MNVMKNHVTLDMIKQLEHPVIHHLKELGHDVYNVKEYKLPIDDGNDLGLDMFMVIDNFDENFYEEYETYVEHAVSNIEEDIIDLQVNNPKFNGKKIFVSIDFNDKINYIDPLRRKMFIGYTLVFADEWYDEALELAEAESILFQWAYDIVRK
jgi:hypothetical protein